MTLYSIFDYPVVPVTLIMFLYAWVTNLYLQPVWPILIRESINYIALQACMSLRNKQEAKKLHTIGDHSQLDQ